MALVQKKKGPSEAGYDDMLAMDPGYQQLSADEDPTPEQEAQFEQVYDEFLHLIEEGGRADVVKIIENSQQLYDGVSTAAFYLLKAAKLEVENRIGPIDPAVFFGEGGMIHSAVDTVFEMAQTAGIRGSDDEQQYTAAQFDMMKKVGEYIQSAQEDGSVEEAQDLLIDIEMSGQPRDVPPPSPQELSTLRQGQEQSMPATEPQAPQQPMSPPSGGLI